MFPHYSGPAGVPDYTGIIGVPNHKAQFVGAWLVNGGKNISIGYRITTEENKGIWQGLSAAECVIMQSKSGDKLPRGVRGTKKDIQSQYQWVIGADAVKRWQRIKPANPVNMPESFSRVFRVNTGLVDIAGKTV